MSQKPRRRGFQFGLGTMFWMTTVTALALFGLRERQLRLQYQAVAETDPSKGYQVQLERYNEWLKRELARAHELYPDFEETGLRVTPNPHRNLRHW
jgi:hypothetical protein